jgi:hypothetical protein
MVVTQPDHGTQTGLIAQAWGNDDVPFASPHPDGARLAARHHDDGWAIWERHPTLDSATQQPIQFHGVRAREHLAAYRAGIARAAQIDPWAGLLVSMHGVGLYNDRYGSYRLEELAEQDLTPDEEGLVGQFFQDMAELQAELYEQATGHRSLQAHADHQVRTDYLALQVWDRLSLQFAFRHAADGVISPLPESGGQLRCRSAGQFMLALDPYPFADDRVDLPVSARLIDDRVYRTPEDFIAALADTAPITIECRAARP